MNPTEEHIKRIQDKLQQLLQQHQQLQKENLLMKQELESERALQQKYRVQLEQLQQQTAILKSSRGEMNSEEKKDLEKRLSQYVKEIDKCITLLKE